MQVTPPAHRPEPSRFRSDFLSDGFFGKLARFGAVGVLNTIIDYAVFVFCFQVMELEPLVANTVAFLIAVNFGYVMNKTWTFRDESRGRIAVTRGILFLASYAIGFVAGSAVLWLASSYVDPRIAKIASIGASLVINFILSKTVVFRSI
jgi:putative flippase GtrA